MKSSQVFPTHCFLDGDSICFVKIDFVVLIGLQCSNVCSRILLGVKFYSSIQNSKT